MTPEKKSINILKYYEEIDSDHVKCKSCFRVIKNDKTASRAEHILFRCSAMARQKESDSNSKTKYYESTLAFRTLVLKILNDVKQLNIINISSTTFGKTS